MSCCRANESDDVKDYKLIGEVARMIAADPERFRRDVAHPVKGEKIEALVKALSAITAVADDQ